MPLCTLNVPPMPTPTGWPAQRALPSVAKFLFVAFGCFVAVKRVLSFTLLKRVVY